MERHQKTKNIIIYMISILSMLPIIYISFYNHPSADDFSYSFRVRQAVVDGGNFFEVIRQAFISSIETMKTWQGLYSSAFVLSLQPAVFGEQFYWFTTIILILSIFCSVLFLTRVIWRKVLENAECSWLPVSIIITFFIINCMPYPVEGLYWYNGAMNYVFFWCVMLVETGLAICYVSDHNSSFITGMIGLTVLSFILSGGNHVTAFAGILIICTLCIYAIVKQKRKGLLFPVMSGMTGFVINLTSEGTRVRSDMLDYHGNPTKTMVASVVKYIMTLNEWVNFTFILLLILLTSYIIRGITNGKKEKEYKISTLLILSFLLTVLVLAMLCVPYQALGSFGAGRVRNIIGMTFIICVVIIYGYLLGIVATKTELWETREKVFIRVGNSKEKNRIGICGSVLTVVCMCVILMFGGTGNNYGTSLEAILELNEAKEYGRQTQERIDIIKQDTSGIVEVQAYTVYPKILYFDDIETDGGNWKNYNMALYYNKTWITKQE